MLPQANLETLANGLRVVLAPDSHAESVTYGLFVSSGSRHEKPGFEGISHFIEHMLFKGTQRRSAIKISQAIEGRGGSFNAFTSEEGTCFYARVPKEEIATAVRIIGEMYTSPAIPESEFDRERRVVIEEIKMYDDEPDSVASENLSKLMFPGSSLGLPIAGRVDSLMSMTPQIMREYIQKAYVPSATVAVLVGNFDMARARRLICETLGHLAGGTPLKFERVDPLAPASGEMTAERDIQQTQLAIGWKTFGSMDDRRFALSVFDAMMGRSMSSRLFQSVREKRGLSYDIRSNLQLFDDAGGWTITAGLDGSRAKEALSTIWREIDKARTKPPSAAELKRTKDYLVGNYRLGFERMLSRLLYYGANVITWGKIIPPEEIARRLQAVTAEEVLSVAKDVLVDDRRSISWVKPQKSANARQ